MIRRWALLAADGHVIQDDLDLRPEQARSWIDEVDSLAPHNAPHYVALAGGDSR